MISFSWLSILLILIIENGLALNGDNSDVKGFQPLSYSNYNDNYEDHRRELLRAEMITKNMIDKGGVLYAGYFNFDWPESTPCDDKGLYSKALQSRYRYLKSIDRTRVVIDPNDQSLHYLKTRAYIMSDNTCAYKVIQDIAHQFSWVRPRKLSDSSSFTKVLN